MARTASQSVQRFPLTVVLGNETNVRLLRELALHGGQISASELAWKARIGRSGAWLGLTNLEKLGIIESAGSERAKLYKLNAKHPFTTPLLSIFQAEKRRFDAIKEEIAASAPGAIAIWIYGSVARGEDHSQSDLDIVVVADAKNFEHVLDNMHKNLVEPSERLNFNPSIVGLTPQDIIRLDSSRDPWWVGLTFDAITVMGKRPSQLAPVTVTE
ncbi:nucleotidyltransferase domain-containing protein [Nitrospirillum viridazoti]|nr:nucleotidyltransferase domain-containing protein [Nitrospirillum amazonense]